MAANDGTGTNWDITNPEDTDYMKNGAMEIRDLRKGIGIRINKEHDTLADNSAGGEHKAGSAKAYVGTTNPTKRPDGVTNLDVNDNGRLFINTASWILSFFHSTYGWLKVIAGGLYSNAVDFIVSKRSKSKSFVFRHDDIPAQIVIAPSGTDEGDDWDWSHKITFGADGTVKATGAMTAAGSTVITKDNLQSTPMNTSSATAGSDAADSFVPLVTMGSFTGSGTSKTITAFASGYVVDHVTVFANQPSGTGISRRLLMANRHGGTGLYFNSGSTIEPVAPPTLNGNTFTISGLAATSGWQYWWTAFGHKS